MYIYIYVYIACFLLGLPVLLSWITEVWIPFQPTMADVQQLPRLRFIYKKRHKVTQHTACKKEMIKQNEDMHILYIT